MLSEVVQQIEQTKWTKINNFSVDIDFVNQQFANICGWESNTSKDLVKALISCSTPQYSNQNINQYVSYEYRYHQGRDEIYRFSMTFRDYDQMKLFKLFRTIYTKSRDQYFDKIRMNIKINNDDDIGVIKFPVFQTTTAIIENVSSLSFNHTTENQVAEFTISIICNTTEMEGVSKHKDAVNTGIIQNQNNHER